MAARGQGSVCSPTKAGVRSQASWQRRDCRPRSGARAEGELRVVDVQLHRHLECCIDFLGASEVGLAVVLGEVAWARVVARHLNEPFTLQIVKASRD